MKKLKTAIIGCGRIAAVYKDCFMELADISKPVFAADKVIDRAAAFANGFGCEYSDNYLDLFSMDVDVVHICTPHFLHREQVERCLSNGINVLTEKPMAISVSDADSMMHTEKASGMKLGVIYQNRYNEGIIKAKELIAKGEIGEIKGAWSHLSWWRPPSYYECDWKGSWEKEGGGVLIDQAIHSIDLVLHLVDSPVKWIHGHIDNRILKSVEVEDVADAVIGFDNGCIYSLYACNYYTANSPIQIEIMGASGKINIKGFEVTMTKDDKSVILSSPPDTTQLGAAYWGSFHKKQIRSFYESIINDEPVKTDALEGKKSLEVVLGVYESSKTNKKVYL